MCTASIQFSVTCQEKQLSVGENEHACICLWKKQLKKHSIEHSHMPVTYYCDCPGFDPTWYVHLIPNTVEQQNIKQILLREIEMVYTAYDVY